MIVKPPPPPAVPLPASAFAYHLPLTAVSVGQPAKPDPEAEALRAEAEINAASGDWPPWFVDVPEGLDQLFRDYGFPRATRESVVDSLRRVYTPRVCRKMRNDSRDREVISGLFQRWPWFVLDLLKTGVALREAQPWSDKGLLSALRTAEGYATATVELEAWANLSRYGYRFDREPPGPGRKRPDFAVYADCWRYIVEVKALRPSDGDRLADRLRTSMGFAILDAQRPGMSLAVQATDALRALFDDSEGRRRIESEADRWLADLAQVVARVAGQPGRYVADEWFEIEVALSPANHLGITSAGVWAGPDDERRAVRIASKVEEAAAQIPPWSTGVALISIVHPVDPAVVHAVLERRIADHPVLLSPIKFVILRSHVRVSPFRFEALGDVVPLRGPLTRSELQLVRVLAS